MEVERHGCGGVGGGGVEEEEGAGVAGWEGWGEGEGFEEGVGGCVDGGGGVFEGREFVD